MVHNNIEVASAKLVALTTDQLKQELTKALAITSTHLQYLAAVWRELESRGEDLSHLKTGLAGYLPMIANGQIDPSLVIRFAGRRTILSALSKLPVEEQKRIAGDGLITVVTLDPGGKRQDVQRPIEQLSQAELFLAISEGGVRDPDKQYLLLSNRTPRKKSVKNVVRVVTVEAHGEDTFFKLGDKRIKEAYLVRALANHYGIDEQQLLDTLAKKSV